MRGFSVLCTAFAVLAGLAAHGQVQPGNQVWSRALSPTTVRLDGVAGTLSGGYVVVGQGGTVLSSPDALHWTAAASGTSAELFGVSVGSPTMGSNLWVAVGAGGTILSSTDGVSWTSRVSGTTADLHAVTNLSGTSWMAVGSGGALLTSRDGITWAVQNSRTTADLDAVAVKPASGLSGSYFVAAGAGGTLLYSLGAAGILVTTNATLRFEALLPTDFSVLTLGEQGLWGEISSMTSLPVASWALSSPTTSNDYVAAASIETSTSWWGEIVTSSGAVLEVGSSISTPNTVAVELPAGVAYHAIALAAAAVVVGDAGTIWTTTQPGGTFTASPAIVGMPAFGLVFAGQTITLQIPANAGTSYQWYLNGIAIPGANQASLTLGNVPVSAGGTYSVAATTALSSSVSSTVINLKPVADFSPHLVDSGFISSLTGAPPQLSLLSSGTVLINGQTLLNSDGSIQATAPTSGRVPSQVIAQADGKWLNLSKFIDSAGDTSLIRYNSDGSTDSSFAVDAGLLDYTASLVVLPNGKFVLFTVLVGQQSVSWRRLLSSGAVDATFTPQTLAVATPAGGVLPVIDATGRIYFAAYSGATPSHLYRLGSNQLLDATFAVAPGTFDQLNLNQIQPVLGGVLYVGSRSGSTPQLGMLDLQGSPAAAYSTRFLDNGAVCSLRPDGTAVALVPSASVTSARCFNLQRFTATGGLDAGYGGRIVADPSPTLGFSTSTDSVDGLLVLPDGRLMVTGIFRSLNLIPEADLARLQPDTHYAGTRLVNASARGRVAPDQNLTLASYLSGAVPSGQPALGLFRADGPALGQFGVSDAVSLTTLGLFPNGTLSATNTGWSSSTSASTIAAVGQAVGAFAFAPNSGDSAVVQNLGPGPISTVVSTPSGSGTALAESYNAGPAPSGPNDLRIVNFSCLDTTSPSQPLTLGFVVAGGDVKSFLIRAVGPGLKVVGVPAAGLLAQPILAVYQGSNLIASNQSLGTSVNDTELLADTSQVGAFAISSAGPDSAVLISLPAGAYTAIASGVGGSAGTVLLEVYEVP